MTAEPKCIGLFGVFGTGNFGNDGSLLAMTEILRRVAPEEPLLCICGNPEAVRQTFGLDAVAIYYVPKPSAHGGGLLSLARKATGKVVLWFHVLKQVRRLKMMIVPGTGILDDFGVWPLAWPYDLLTWCILARVMGVKVVLASVGAGPIHHPVSRWFMKLAAGSAHYRSYRDQLSKSFMESIGSDVSNDPIYPDIAFSLPKPPDASEENAHLTIGVGLMTYFGWKQNPRASGTYTRYIEKMVGFVRWALSEGYGVRLIMGDLSDMQAVTDVLQALKKEGDPGEALLFEPARTLHEIMDQMARVDLVVATRFHNVICALKMGKPTLSIGYAKKNDALLGEAGLGDFCQDIELLDLERLKTQTKNLIADRTVLAKKIRETCRHFESELGQQNTRIKALMAGA